MPPKLESVDHVHVYVHNRAAAETWYHKVLGLTRVKQFESWTPNDGPLMLGAASLNFKIALFERSGEKCHSTIAFAASAIEFLAWKSHLAASLDLPPELEDHELSWSLYFRDPDGNPYEITSYDYAELIPHLR
jgi:catechol-2,3-dioxygenase